jgi:hygromycin-B 4-O-kinase
MDFKPIMNFETIVKLLESCMSGEIENLFAYKGGNMNQVFSFDCAGKGYILRLGNKWNGNLTDAQNKKNVLNEFVLKGAPLALNLKTGESLNHIYHIAERLEGTTLSTLNKEERKSVMPGMINIMSRLHLVDVSGYRGYGWITSLGNGEFETWEQYVSSFYQPEQEGFWEGWVELFETSFLERDIFQECYARMLHYAQYSAPYRYLIHTDCHDGNIIVNGDKIVGLIDGNYRYGDFIIDLIRWIGSANNFGMRDRFLERYEQMGFPLDNLQERILGNTYFSGLDALRFYAKANRRGDYERTREQLLSLS